jgi:hypothetical protein
MGNGTLGKALAYWKLEAVAGQCSARRSTGTGSRQCYILRAAWRIVGDRNRAGQVACSAGHESHADNAVRSGCEG